MGQYHLTVNLTKREFINPHALGNGLKLWEQIEGGPGSVTAALFALLAVSNGRGGGDILEDPEIVGRWGGDRIAVIGDYADDSDIKDSPIPASEIYSLCRDEESRASPDFEPDEFGRDFTDITPKVCAYLERLFDGRYIGEGWRKFVMKGATVTRWRKKKDGPQEQESGTVTDISENAVTVQWPGKAQTYTRDSRPDFF